MKIVLCHNYYQQPGGEDQSFDDEARLLQAHGHEVVRFTMHNDAIETMGRIRLAARTLWHGDVYRRLGDLLRKEKPQVMHCTNTFPLISPSAYYTARAQRVPVVQSLRNYRLLCANGLLLRNGHACEDCLHRSLQMPAVIHRCYRDSRSATAVVALMIGGHRAAGTWQRAVDLYFTPSEFARRKYIEGGFPADRIAVKPNFVLPDPGPGSGGGNEGGAIFVGRLSHEKGVETLLDAWLHHSPPLKLKIIGDGPLADRVKQACAQSDRIQWIGRVPISQALTHIGESALLISPSITYETFGRTVVEAFAKGTPVLTSDSGASAELVAPGVTGMHFRTGNAADLAAKVRQLASEPGLLASMRGPARLDYEQKYDSDSNYRMLMSIYERAIARVHGPHNNRPHESGPQQSAGASVTGSSNQPEFGEQPS